LLLADGLPGGANLQERFFVLRVTAQILLDDRILTRLVQGFGRCTRSPNDYAAVVVLGENLNSYLFKKERREFFHPEIQAELEFGLEQSKSASAKEMLQNLSHFFSQDADWDAADKAIVALRSGLTQHTLAATQELADAVAAELTYQYTLWNADFTAALEQCRAVIGKLTHSDLRGYRALWLYLAGSAAWLAHQANQLPTDEIAKDYFRKAQAAAPVLRWLVSLQTDKTAPAATATTFEPRLAAMIERLALRVTCDPANEGHQETGQRIWPNCLLRSSPFIPSFDRPSASPLDVPGCQLSRSRRRGCGKVGIATRFPRQRSCRPFHSLFLRRDPGIPIGRILR